MINSEEQPRFNDRRWTVLCRMILATLVLNSLIAWGHPSFAAADSAEVPPPEILESEGEVIEDEAGDESESDSEEADDTDNKSDENQDSAESQEDESEDSERDSEEEDGEEEDGEVEDGEEQSADEGAEEEQSAEKGADKEDTDVDDAAKNDDDAASGEQDSAAGEEISEDEEQTPGVDTESESEASDEEEVAEVDGTEEPESVARNQPVVDEPSEGIETLSKSKRIIGATATLMEKQSELLFRARVDTGAKSCSMHIENMVIEDESERMADNIGKVIRFKVKNNGNETHWLEGKIAGYVIVKTSGNLSKERRYKVPVTLRWKDVEKTVLMTLNNRAHMDYPLLLGRNFLLGDFVVDVEMDNID